MKLPSELNSKWIPNGSEGTLASTQGVQTAPWAVRMDVTRWKIQVRIYREKAGDFLSEMNQQSHIGLNKGRDHPIAFFLRLLEEIHWLAKFSDATHPDSSRFFHSVQCLSTTFCSPGCLPPWGICTAHVDT